MAEWAFSRVSVAVVWRREMSLGLEHGHEAREVALEKLVVTDEALRGSKRKYHVSDDLIADGLERPRG